METEMSYFRGSETEIVNIIVTDIRNHRSQEPPPLTGIRNSVSSKLIKHLTSYKLLQLISKFNERAKNDICIPTYCFFNIQKCKELTLLSNRNVQKQRAKIDKRFVLKNDIHIRTCFFTLLSNRNDQNKEQLINTFCLIRCGFEYSILHVSGSLLISQTNKILCPVKLLHNLKSKWGKLDGRVNVF